MKKSCILYCWCCWASLFFPPPDSVVDGQEQHPADWMQFGHARNWRSPIELNSSNSLSVAWDMKLGAGRSQVVGIGDRVYITTGKSEEQNGKLVIRTHIQSINAANGRQVWNHQESSEKYPSQENFSGATISPQATPAISGNHLIAISFTGQLSCLDRNDGNLIWEKDLVEQLGAKPVQFGFSSSPVVDPDQPDRVYVLAAGKSGGLFCLDVDDGSTIWKSTCTTFSYATPVFAEFGDRQQLIIVSQDELLGIDASDGSPLWQHALAEQGLTNVPTPLVLDRSRLIISGQGCKGTRCLSISRAENQWQVTENWFVRNVQFFYTNWIKLTDQIVLGCTDKYLAAIDVDDGEVLGRWRGFGDGNVIIADQVLLLLDGKGKLSILDASDVSDTGITISQQYKILNARCWTPISTVGKRVFVRGDQQLVCLSADPTDGKLLENILANPKLLEVSSSMDPQNGVVPIQQISND